MSKKSIACVAVFAALLAGPGSECCYPGSPCCGDDCCYEGSPCCNPPQACCSVVSVAAKTKAGCCEPGAECCFPGSPCCGDDCCYEGSPCCDPPQACCLAVSAVTVEGAKGCCAVATKADAKEAGPAANVTPIAVEDMDCPSCAKKVVAKLTEVPGVEKVVADIKASKLRVTPKGKGNPSPKAMWQAVEKAGFTPTRLEGPGGTFAALPKE